MYFILGSAKVLSAHHGGYGWLTRGASSGISLEGAVIEDDSETAETRVVEEEDFDEWDARKGSASGPPLDPVHALGGSLVAMKKNVQGTMLLTITSNSVFLWCTRPSVMISKCRRRKSSVKSQGTNVDVIWKPDSTAFAVLTSSKNHIHIYDVLAPGQSQPRNLESPAPFAEDPLPPRMSSPAPRNGDLGNPEAAGIDTRLFRYEFMNSQVAASSGEGNRGGVPVRVPPQSYITGPGEGAGVPARQIRWRGSIDVSKFGGIACIFTLTDEIVVSTKNGQNELLSYSWYCHPPTATPTSSTELASLGFLRKTTTTGEPSTEKQDSLFESRLVAVWPDKSSELFVWCVAREPLDGANGSASTAGSMECFFVQRRRRSGDKTKFTWNGIVLPSALGQDERVTAAAINTRHLLVALGTSSGKVMIFSISDTGKSSTLSHHLGNALSGSLPASLAHMLSRGSVGDLDFSNDGLCIACGFRPLANGSGGGLGVWSIYGRWLAGTVGGPEDFEASFSKADTSLGKQGDDPTPLEEDGTWMRGVASLFWGVGSYELFLLPSVSPLDAAAALIPGSEGKDSGNHFDESVMDIYVVPLAKLPNSGCPNIGATQHMYLQTDDRLLIHTTALHTSVRAKPTDSRSQDEGARSRDAPSPLLGLGVTYGSVVDLGHPDPHSTHGSLYQGGPLTPEAHQQHRPVRDRADTSVQVSLDPEMAQWFSVQIPPAYITSNWPIKYSAPTPNMDYLAVAGRRGFAIYVIRQNRWRLFGNEVQEASFAVKGGLLWWEPSEFSSMSSVRGAPTVSTWNNGPILIVPCLDLAGNDNKLRFFHSTSNLDLRTCLATQPLTRGIISMDLRDDTLLVYSADNVVRVFSLELGVKPSISVRLHHQYSLATCVPFPATVQSVFWLPTVKTLFSYYTPTILQQQPVVILNHGKLFVFLPQGASGNLDVPVRPASAVDALAHLGRSGTATPALAAFPPFGSVNSVAPDFQTPAETTGLSTNFLQLTQGVEFVYLTSGNERLGNYLCSTLWAVGGNKIKSWFNFGVSLVTPDLDGPVVRDVARHAILQSLGGSENPTLDFAVEFFPYTISVHKGLVTGLSQHMSLRSSLDAASYKVQTETNLWLPKLLRFLLSNNLDEIAAQVAYYYIDLDYFAHALEVLLHDVLDDEASGGETTTSLLPRVVRFLQRFPNYLEVVVQCARKSEYALWEYLFSIVGDAKNLFEQCLDMQQLRTATSYLLILQTLEPASVSSKYAVELLERSFESEDYDLCKELVRFLSSITTSSGSATPAYADTSSSAAWIQQISNRIASMEVTQTSDEEDNAEEKKPEDDQEDSAEGRHGPTSAPTARHHAFRDDRLIADSPGVRSPDVRNKHSKFSEEAEARVLKDYGSRTLPDGTDLFYIEVLVSKHARNLLSSYRLRTLGRLASSLRFPLISWARKEKNRTAIIADWNAAFTSLHQQFGLPMPDDSTIMTTLAELAPLSSFKPGGSLPLHMASVESPSVLSPTSPSDAMDYLRSKRLNTVGPINTSAIGEDEPHGSSVSAGVVPPATLFTEQPANTASPTSADPRRDSPLPLVSRLSSMPASAFARRQSTFSDAARLKLKIPGGGVLASLNASQIRHYREVITELQDLQEAMKASSCVQWVLLISSALMDVDTLVETFAEASKSDNSTSKELLTKWTEMLENTGARGYQELVIVTRAELVRKAVAED